MRVDKIFLKGKIEGRKEFFLKVKDWKISNRSLNSESSNNFLKLKIFIFGK